MARVYSRYSRTDGRHTLRPPAPPRCTAQRGAKKPRSIITRMPSARAPSTARSRRASAARSYARGSAASNEGRLRESRRGASWYQLAVIRTRSTPSAAMRRSERLTWAGLRYSSAASSWITVSTRSVAAGGPVKAMPADRAREQAKAFIRP